MLWQLRAGGIFRENILLNIQQRHCRYDSPSPCYANGFRVEIFDVCSLQRASFAVNSDEQTMSVRLSLFLAFSPYNLDTELQTLNFKDCTGPCYTRCPLNTGTCSGVHMLMTGRSPSTVLCRPQWGHPSIVIRSAVVLSIANFYPEISIRFATETAN